MPPAGIFSQQVKEAGNGLLMSWRYFEGAEQAGTPMAATGEGALPVAAEVARSSA